MRPTGNGIIHGGVGGVPSALVRAAVGVALAWLMLAGLPAAAATRDADALERANALLAEQATWDQAIALYRTLLEADPDWVEPRYQLASVLAWRGDYDESLAHFDRLATSPDAPPELAIQRAEVLSWAGRTDEARTAFEQQLAAKPDDARASRGLARTLRWSGDRGQADVWYRKALALEDDTEARQEYDAMRAELGREVSGGGRAYFDSEHLSYYRSDARFALDWDFDTKLYASSATLWVSQDREEGDVPSGDPDHTRGIESRFGLERRLNLRTKGFAEVGARFWEHARSVPLGRMGFEWNPRESTSVTVEVLHEDMFDRSLSLDSILEDVRRTGGKASLWSQLTPSVELYAESGGAYLSGGNGEMYGNGSVSWRPFAARDLGFAISAGVSRYQEQSDFYYSPQADVDTTLSMFGRVPIAGPLAFTFDVGGGAGMSRDQGETQFGPAYRVKAGFAVRRGALSLDLDAGRTESVRETSYKTHEVTLRAGWKF